MVVTAVAVALLCGGCGYRDDDGNDEDDNDNSWCSEGDNGDISYQWW